MTLIHNNKLKVTAVTIKDVLGAREFSMEPGQINVLAGSNGTGKSTALEAIKSAIGGGNLAKLQRISNVDGEEITPEMVIIIEGDAPSDHLRIEKTGKGVRVRQRIGDTAGLEDVVQPQRFLDGLFDGSLVNPIEFLKAPDKERVLLLLEALPVSFNRDELWKSLGVKKKDFQPVPEQGLHPITELSLIRETIFRERTGVNRDVKQKAATAEQTRRAIPAVLPEGHDEKIKTLDEEIKREDSQIAAQIVTAKKETEAKAAELKANHAARAAELRNEVEALIANLKAEMHDEIALLESAKDTALDALLDEQRKVEEKQRALQALRAEQENNIRFKALAEQADKFDRETEELQTKAAQLTEAIDRLDAFRRSLLDDLPIKGLGVEDKTITIDGIPFDQVNTAKKIQMAVQIACLRTKDKALPFILVDGAEALDSENFAHFVEAIKAEGVQAFIGRVVDAPLTVEVQ